MLELTRAELNTIEADLRATLDDLQLSLGPEHTDEDGAIVFRSTVADVNFDVNDGAGDVSILTCEETSVFRVLAVADTPVLNIVDPSPPSVLLDGDNIPLCINVIASPDNATDDNSETLSVRITVPLDNSTNAPIGQIVYNGTLPDGVTITSVSDGVWLIEADGATPAERQDLLNSVLCDSPSSLLQLDPSDGFAGSVDVEVEFNAHLFHQFSFPQRGKQTATKCLSRQSL